MIEEAAAQGTNHATSRSYPTVGVDPPITRVMAEVLSNPADRMPLDMEDAPAVGERTAKGFAWTLAQNVIEKGVQGAGQLALAWLLLKEDFKLVTLTATVTTFAMLLQQFGLKQVLVQRQREFDRWATPAFWMSMALGLAAGAITIGAAPLAASFFEEPALVGLLSVAAIALPAWSLALVPEAKLSAHMQFRFFAKLGVICSVLTFGLSVVLAMPPLRMGPYAIILPLPIVALIRAAILWWLAGVRVRFRPELSSWPHLIGDSTIMLVCGLAMMVTYQGHYTVLGRLERKDDILGAFYLAYSLSDQATRTLMLNLSGVLFPALSSLHEEPARQAKGFLKAVRALMLVGIPLCFLQAVIAGPVFRVLLPQRWGDATGMFVIFSVAMLGRLILGPCESMILAQRRQKTWLVISVCYAAGFVAATIAGTLLGRTWGPRLGGALGVAIGPAEGCAMGVALALNVVAPVAMRCCIAPAKGTWRDVWEDYRFPVLASAASALAAWLAIYPLPQTRAGGVAALVIAPAVMGAIYLALVMVFARESAADLLRRTRRLIPARIAPLIERWFFAAQPGPPE